jgi:hypothetical protein
MIFNPITHLRIRKVPRVLATQARPHLLTYLVLILIYSITLLFSLREGPFSSVYSKMFMHSTL